MVWLVLVAAIIPTMALGTPVSAPGKLAQDPDVVAFVSGLCTLHNSETKIPEIMDTIDKVQTCTESLTKGMKKINYSDASRNGDIDQKMKQYCALVPELKNCTYSMLNFVSLCGDKDDKNDVESTRYFVDQVIDYACHKDGERIASFEKEGGFQCLEKNSKAIRKCSSFIADQIESDDDEDTSEENDTCEVFEHTSNCFVSAMEDCPAAPIKIVKDLSEHVRKVANCTGSEVTGMKIYREWLQTHVNSN